MSASRTPVPGATEKGWRLSVTVLPSRYAVCKLDAYAPTPEWGLHLIDANVAQGDLVDDIRRQIRAYASR